MTPSWSIDDKGTLHLLEGIDYLEKNDNRPATDPCPNCGQLTQFVKTERKPASIIIFSDECEQEGIHVSWDHNIMFGNVAVVTYLYYFTD